MIPETLPTEFQERFAAAGIHLRMGCHIHVALRFPAATPLDPARLARAARRLVDAEPVLACRFDLSTTPPVWRRHPDPDAVPWFETRPEPGWTQAITAVLAAEEPWDGRNLIVRLLALPDGQALVLSVNHAAADGAAALDCLARLAALYAALAADPAHVPNPNAASRDSFEWLHAFRLRHHAKTLLRDLHALRWARTPVLNLPGAPSFDAWRNHPRDRPGFVECRIPPERLAAIDRLAAAHATTRFAVLAAAMARAFARLVPAEPGAAFRVMLASNLRRFAPAARTPAIRNMSGIAPMTFHPAPSAPFHQTLAAAARATETLASGLGGGMNPIAIALLRRIPDRWKRALMDKVARRTITAGAPPSFSNVGRLHESRVTFATAVPDHAVILGAAFPLPMLQVTGLEFRRSLTLAMPFQADGLPQPRAQAFLDAVLDEIPLDPSS